MNSKELRNQIEGINDKIRCLISGFEITHDLKKDVAYQIHTIDSRTFRGYYSHCEIGASRWDGRDKIYIHACFFKVKKNGEKSKVGTGCLADDVIEVNRLPF